MHDSRRTRLVLGAPLAVAIALVTVDAVSGSARSVVSSVTRPVNRIFASVGQQAEITRLEQEAVRLHAELWLARQARLEWAQLHSVEQLAGRGRYRIAAATVTAGTAAYGNTVTIDAGSADGIKPDETVLNGAGLVGVVNSVGVRSSTVLLAIGPSVTVGVRMAGTSEIGWVTGLGRSRPALLRLQVPDAQAVLRPGEQLVTKASVGDRPYVPGVPVGVITRVTTSANSLTRNAYVRRPFTNDDALGVIGVVIAPPRRNPGDSVLPTPPGPTAAG